MDKNLLFGNRRNIDSRQEDFGYSDMAFATGDLGRIATLQTALSQKNIELSAVEKTIGDTSAKIKTNQKTIAERNAYAYGKNKLCKWSDSQSKCDSKRREYKAQWITPVQMSLNLLAGNLNSLQQRKTALEGEIQNVTNEIATLLEAQQLEAQSTLTLAQQGKTPEQIRIEAEAQANAMAQQAKTDADTKERKSKSTKIIILSIILSAVALTGIYVYYRIKKNKSK